MSNAAAERLIKEIGCSDLNYHRAEITSGVERIQAAERKATVERIRKRLGLETIGNEAEIVFSPGVLQKILNELSA